MAHRPLIDLSGEPRELLNLVNVLLDLESLTLRSYDPQGRSTIRLPHRDDPPAYCNRLPESLAMNIYGMECAGVMVAVSPRTR